MRFIDLFAGLGGFHLALKSLGHTCVFASEIDETLRDLYQKNFSPMKCAGDIRNIEAADIPQHDILCAGFPCQPFSKAGRQSGLDDPKLGDLYKHILRVIEYHVERYGGPEYLILENVPNLEFHSKGKSWQKIKGLIEEQGYKVGIEKISPEQFGIPQIRKRIYIVGSRAPLNVSKRLNRGRRHKSVSLQPFLLKNPPDALPVPEYVMERIEAWQEFLDLVPKGERFPHPLWAMEFGATYPYQATTPSALSTEELRHYKGSFGRSLVPTKSREEIFSLLPSHARKIQDVFPEWKVRFIQQNREFFEKHEALLGDWAKKVQRFPSSFQKFEWNCREKNPLDEIRHLSQYVIQMRASGVRVKRQTTVPSLVAMTATQVPIIMWEGRYMTPTEGKLLQSMDELRYLPESPTKAYEALGNAVNVRVARRVAMALVGRASGKGPSVLSQQSTLEASMSAAQPAALGW